MTERQWIEAAGRGDLDAFAHMIEGYAPEVYRNSYESSGDPDEALDLTRSTFLRAWHGISLYDMEEPFPDWLSRIHSDVLEAWRRKHRPPDSVPENPAVPEDLSLYIRRSIQQENARYGVKSVLGRFRFTLIAIVVVLLMLLFSRLRPQTDMRKPAQEPSAVSTPVIDAETRLIPGS